MIEKKKTALEKKKVKSDKKNKVEKISWKERKMI